MRQTGRNVLSLLIVLTFAFHLLPVDAEPVSSAGTISIETMQNLYEQNFDTLAGSAMADASTLPVGWYMVETGTSANSSYAAGNGSSSTGNTYSFGLNGEEDRALGGLLSNSVTPTIGAQFTNNTGKNVRSLFVLYYGEQWRLGALNRTDQLNFQYSTDATSLSTGTWMDVDELDFVAPKQTGTVGALNGNHLDNQTAVSWTFSGMNISNGSTFWVRWTDFNATSSDDGLAVDNFTLGVMDTALDVAPQVSDNSPKNGDTNVFAHAPITITFSEEVDVVTGWFTFNCDTGSTPTLAVTGGPITFTFTHTEDFPATASCTFAIPDPTKVTDKDGTADALSRAFSFSFTVEDEIPLCEQTYTPIYSIQGSGTTAAITGTVTTQGVVVGDFETNALNPGFFIQDVHGDGNAATSDGLFVFTSTADLVQVGQVIRVTGFARERFSQTTLNGSNSNTAAVPAQNIFQCGSTASITPVAVTLPLADPGFTERYEGMLVRFPQTLFVTDTYSLGRHGQVTVSSTNRLFQPTAQELPGSQAAVDLQAANTLNQMIVDDGNDNQNVDPIVFGRGGSPLFHDNTLRSGDTISGMVGVLNYAYSAYRVNPIGAMGGFFRFEPANQRPAAAPSVGGTLKISAFNTLNFFNTFTGCTLGVGGGTTDCRGPNSAAEYDRQWRKTVQAIVKLDADVVGINEIENDGYGSDSAIADLVNKLNEATAPGTYAFINADGETGQTNALGTDAIKVSILYKPAKVTPVGNTAVLNTGAFGQYQVYKINSNGTLDYNVIETTGRNRPSLVQAFEENSSGERVIVSVNHLKSKGSTCENNISPVGPDPDKGDGQGNCNLTRKAATTELMNWLAADPTGTGETDILILGDLNSYTFEDPILALTSGGYTNLILDRLGEESYSYSFDGQWGYLDHALASASLHRQVAGVTHYAINADEPVVLDYNTEYKSSGQIVSLYAPDAFRSSDHDPVIVGLRFGEQSLQPGIWLPSIQK